MLVAVIMIFVVFSFTGIAVINVSYLSSSATSETIDNIKLQYAVESTVNEALWRINAGEDSLVNISEDGISCVWESGTNVLTVSVEQFEMESEILLDLAQDTHFDRGLSSDSPIYTYGYDVEVEEEHRQRRFSFLPETDLQYFIDNADVIHHGNDKSWKTSSFDIEGIHLFTGNNLDINGISLNNSTFVFTGKGISFSGTNILKAPVPTDSLNALPALVFTHPETEFTISSGNHIAGAIFCAGQIVIQEAVLTGPILAHTIFLNNDLDLLDDEHPQYYRWTDGFGERNDYDWPKQIGRWKTVKWNKKVAA